MLCFNFPRTYIMFDSMSLHSTLYIYKDKKYKKLSFKMMIINLELEISYNESLFQSSFGALSPWIRIKGAGKCIH